MTGTVRHAINTDRISFLNRRDRSVHQPQPRWAGVHPQAGDATDLEMRSISTEFVARLDPGSLRANAYQANSMGQRLAAGVKQLADVNLAYGVQDDAVYATICGRQTISLGTSAE